MLSITETDPENATIGRAMRDASVQRTIATEAPCPERINVPSLMPPKEESSMETLLVGPVTLKHPEGGQTTPIDVKFCTVNRELSTKAMTLTQTPSYCECSSRTLEPDSTRMMGSPDDAGLKDKYRIIIVRLSGMPRNLKDPIGLTARGRVGVLGVGRIVKSLFKAFKSHS